MDFHERSEDEANLVQAQEALGTPGTNDAVLSAAGNTVTLPAGSAIEALEVDGRDLIIVLTDGTRVVVPDGAVFVPQIIVGGVVVPPQNVAQLLTGNEPEPAAGRPQSSGGNFADDEGAIQDAFDLGDLLPFTDFGFPQDREEEIIPAFIDRDPEVVIETPDNPAGVTSAIATVDEEGLPERGAPREPKGTNEAGNGETASGTIVFNSPDGLSAILINGVAITQVGQNFTSPVGRLTITSINLATGEIGFTYTLLDNTIGQDRDGFFQVTVIDTDGDQASASLTINIVDDGPIAANDIGIVPAGSHAPIAGNVLVNDVSGADNFPATGGVVTFGRSEVSVAAGGSVQGQYGILTIKADGSYTYTRGLNTPGGVEESFTYTIVDQDGSRSTATLVIRIADAQNAITFVPETGDGTVVDEGGLGTRPGETAGTGEIADNDANNNSDKTETTGSTITFNSPDGVASVSINGVTITPGALPQTIVQTTGGTLVITSYSYDPVTGNGTIGYVFTLGDNTAGDSTKFDFTIRVVDLDGDSATDTVTINVVDDTPTAVDDAATQAAENAPVTVNVFANDTPGADNVALSAIAPVAGSLSGTGTLVYNGNGTFTYTPGPGEEGTVTFDYSITDGDGDVATATVTISLLEDSLPEIAVEGDDDVAEAGLPARGSEAAGSDAASASETAVGAIGIGTGNDAVASLVINGVNVTGGGTVTTAKGVLTVTFANGSYGYSYTLTDNTLVDPDSDTFTLVVTDSDGDTASTSLVIAIVDDVPDAADDANAIAAGLYGPVGGNVLANDTQGADSAKVTSYSGAGGSGGPGDVVQGLYGFLTIAADGSYSYTRNPGTPGGVSDSFGYTITDGDGDTASALLVIAIANSGTSLDLPALGEAGTQVAEAGLAGPPAGSDAASDSEFTSGVFTFTAPDGPATVTIGGVAVTAVGQTFVGAHGTLTVTAIAAGSISYIYELQDNTSGDATQDAFVVRVTDKDGDFSQDTLRIAIVDDRPSAAADVDSVTEDGPLVADGNVLTGSGGADANATDGAGDVLGADGASVTGVAAGTPAGPVAGSVGAGVAGDYGSLTIGSNGDYSYVLDNANALVQGLDGTETLTDVFSYTVTDGDGDTTTTTVTVTINGTDDPVVITGLDGEGAEETLFENDLADGSSPDAAALVQTGSFTITSQDGLATLTVGGVVVFSASATTTYPVTVADPVYGILTITGVTSTTDANGDVVAATVSYRYVLDDNSLLHTGGNNGSFVDSFAVVATDTDGSTDTASLDIRIVDDAPTATDNSNTVTEGGSIGGNLLSDDDGAGIDVPGADGYGLGGAVIAVASSNQGTTQDTVDASGKLVLAGQFGTLTVDPATGVYSYESNPNSTNTDAQDIFTYTIIDGDGDTSTATLTIDINNVAGQVSDNDVLVNEAGLPSGSDASSSSEVDADGQITVAGASGTLVYTLLSPANGTYGTLVLDSATGAYTYTLDTPFTDAVNENGANVVNGAESFAYEVRDTLGNLIGSGSIAVNIVDDIPNATDQAAVVVAEDAVGTIGGNVMLDGVDDTEGADGASVTAITIDGVTTAVPQNGSTATVVTAKGTYTIDRDGNWTFDPNPNQNQSGGNISAGFTYTLTDGDGDFDTAAQPIFITDGRDPSAGPDIALALDDQNLADGSSPAAPDGDSDTIVFTPGSDAIASIVFGGTAGLGGGLTWVRVSDSQITGSDGGRLVVTLNLTLVGNTATVTATLNDNYDSHPTIDVDDLVDLGDVDVVATDIDGDEARSTVSISVSDDLPTVTAGTPVAGALTVDESDFATDAVADFSGLFTPDYNADNPGTIGGYSLGINAGATGLVDTASGQAVVLVKNGAVIEGRTAGSNLLVFTVTVDAAGSVTLDQQRAVKHADTANDNEPVGFAAANLITLSATVTDSDGDTATAIANIAGSMTFLDDGPALSNVALGTGVDVDESNGFPTSDTSLAPVISYTANFGADGNNGTTFALSVTNAASGLATAAGDFPITLVQTNATTITGTYNDGTGTKTAFTVVINGDGTVTLTQNVALEHLVDGPEGPAHDDTLNLAGKISANVTIKDGDNDTDSASVQIGGALVFYDDGPSVVLSGTNPDLQVSDAALATDATLSFAGAFTFAGGNDGSAGTSYALAVTGGQPSGIVDTLTGNAVFLFLEAGVVVGREGADAGAAATGEKVFTVSVDGSGNVKLDQLRAVDHSASTLDGANATLSADNLVRLTATITDRDGDTDSATLNIGSDLLFADDVPTSEPTLVVYLDDDALGGNANGPGDQSPDTLNLTGTLVDPAEGFGNDGGTVAFDLGSTLPAGFRLADDPASDGVLIQQEQGAGNWVTVVTVTLNGATGAYTVSQQNNVWHIDNGLDNENEVTFTLGATLTDGDNDTATTSLTIVVDDDTPAISGGQVSRILTVDEDGLSGGIANNGTNDATGEALGVTTSVTGDFLAGADDPLTYAFDTALANLLPALTSGGVAVSYVVTANSIVATAGTKPIFTVTLNATTGQFIFTLQGPVDHADANDSENVTDIDINFGPLITATDVDGDTIHNTKGFIIRIDDDTPRANPDTDSLTEDAVNTIGNVVEGTGTDSGLAGKDEGGADGLASPVVKAITGFGGAAGTLGGNTTGEWGTLVMNSDGSYTYTPNNAALQVLDTGESRTDTFTYTIEDKDGDAVSTTLIIRIDGVNDAPVANPDTNWTIEDAGAPITGNVLANVLHPGAPSGTFADVADTDVDVEPLSVTTVGTFNGTYGILTLNSNGTYSYSLYTQAQNPTAYNAVQALNASSTPLVDTFNYTASDGLASNGSTLKISIFGANDAPMVTGSITAVSDEGLTGGLPDNVGTPTDTTDSFEASGKITITDVDNTTFVVKLVAPTTPGLTSGGLPVTWQASPDGKTLVGSTTAGTVLLVAIDDGGNWTVDLVRPIDHSNTSAEDILSFNIPITVSDGSATTLVPAGIALTIEDDRPVAVSAADMTATNGAGTYTASLDTDNDVDNNFGGDGGRVIFTQASIDALVAQNLTSGLSPLSYQIIDNGTTLVAVKQGTTTEVFRLTLDPASSQDNYVLQVSLPLDATSNINFNDGTYQFLGGNTPWAGFVPNGQNPFGPGGGTYVDDLSQDLLLTPFSPNGRGDAINGNANSAGVTGGGGGQNVGENEGIRLDFVLDLENDPAKAGGGGADYDGDLTQRDHSFVEHYDVNGAVVRFGDGQSNTLASFKAFVVTDAPDDGPVADPVLGTGTLAIVNKIVIEYDGEKQEVIFDPLQTYPITVTVGNPGGLADRSYTVNFINSGGGRYATVLGIYDVNVKIATFATTNYQALEIQHLSGDDFALTGFGTTTITDDPVPFSVPISIVDNDGDLIASEDIDIVLNAPVAGAAALGTQAIASTLALLEEGSLSVASANDNGSAPGSGAFAASLSQQEMRAGMRVGGTGTIAAMSGALLFDAPLAAQGWNQPLAPVADLADLPGTFAAQAEAGWTLTDTSAFELPTLGLGNDYRFDGNAMSTTTRSGEGDDGRSTGIQQLLDVQPDTYEAMAELGAGPGDVSAFSFGQGNTLAVDQAMDALLALGGTPDGAPSMLAAEPAVSVLAEIAAEAALDAVLDKMIQPVGNGEWVIGGEPLHAGLLDQQLVNESPRFAAGPLDLDHLDAAAVAASQS
ncbi:DUF5801 repeats-in-toxin domain-containing protein [Parerythrobacter aurantius]|uniref:DUF5801 repeats-in-toxin domain-containing protein n=1 Tax=Parerythrobacter aurantius TaxID=3127706 RepID=UPI00324B0A35